MPLVLPQAMSCRQQVSYPGGFIERIFSRNIENMHLADLLTEINSGCVSQIQDESGIDILPLVSFVSF